MNPTPIDGLEIHPLDVHADNRGWFKENWSGQRLRPVQNNISFNARVGATRGMHAEPWDKWVSVATGRVFAAWVDLREGSETFATKFGVEIGPDTAVFVPRGVANGFQALEDGDVRCAVGLLAFGGLLVVSHVAPLALRENRCLTL